MSRSLGPVAAVDAQDALIYRDGILDYGAHDTLLIARGYKYFPHSPCTCDGSESDGHLPTCGWGRAVDAEVAHV